MLASSPASSSGAATRNPNRHLRPWKTLPAICRADMLISVPRTYWFVMLEDEQKFLATRDAFHFKRARSIAEPVAADGLNIQPCRMHFLR